MYMKHHFLLRKDSVKRWLYKVKRTFFAILVVNVFFCEKIIGVCMVFLGINVVKMNKMFKKCNENT